MEIQGPEEAVRRVLGALENASFIEVTRMESSVLKVLEDERDFRTE